MGESVILKKIKKNFMITIYSTQTCQYCKAAKEFFKEQGWDYKEIDVSENVEAQEEMIKKSGQMGVPVIVIEKDGSEEIIIGFDKDELLKKVSIS